MSGRSSLVSGPSHWYRRRLLGSRPRTRMPVASLSVRPETAEYTGRSTHPPEPKISKGK